MESFWRRCSTCKRELGFATPYWTCSVSTCNRKGNAFVFCSVSCWNGHVPTMRHREAWAEQQRSPNRDEWGAQPPAPPVQPGVSRPPAATAAKTESGESDRETDDAADTELVPGEIPRDILIVASKLKKYIRVRAGMNTSEGVIDVLSDRVRALCEDAIVRAREDGRKTVMDRDF